MRQQRENSHCFNFISLDCNSDAKNPFSLSFKPPRLFCKMQWKSKIIAHFPLTRNAIQFVIENCFGFCCCWVASMALIVHTFMLNYCEISNWKFSNLYKRSSCSRMYKWMNMLENLRICIRVSWVVFSVWNYYQNAYTWECAADHKLFRSQVQSLSLRFVEIISFFDKF